MQDTWNFTVEASSTGLEVLAFKNRLMERLAEIIAGVAMAATGFMVGKQVIKDSEVNEVANYIASGNPALAGQIIDNPDSFRPQIDAVLTDIYVEHLPIREAIKKRFGEDLSSVSDYDLHGGTK